MPAQIFNLDYLYEVFEGNKASIIEVVELFIKELPVATKALNTAAKSKDKEEIRKSAHKIKSSLRAVGAKELADIAAKMEHACDKNFNEIPGLLNKFNEMLPELQNELTDYLSANK
jgi:HPt (histidine-containing phosphotransfer) domain-containing protein